MADFVVSMVWLYARTGETWPLELARKGLHPEPRLAAEFDAFKYTGKTQEKLELDTHGVNTGMALKYDGLRYLLSGDLQDRERGLLHARSPRQAPRPGHRHLHLRRAPGRPQPIPGNRALRRGGSQYSLEVLSAVTGDARLGDRLEKLAFNALPATFKTDMWAHQYDQQCNQVVCSKAGEHV